MDVRAKLWTCPFCLTRNQLPTQYSDISETNLPAELIPDLTSLEYRLPQAPAGPPVFLFVMDLGLDADELQVRSTRVRGCGVFRLLTRLCDV